MDITYIPMARLCLPHGRDGLGESARLELARVSHARQRLLYRCRGGGDYAKYGCPEIFNTDQGAQFTSAAFAFNLLHAHGITISMDGQGCWRDNIFVERLWRTIKYEEVYLHAYDTVSAATAGLTRYLTLYNTRRPHSSLADQTPDEAYFTPLSNSESGVARPCIHLSQAEKLYRKAEPYSSTPGRRNDNPSRDRVDQYSVPAVHANHRHDWNHRSTDDCRAVD